MSRLAPLIRIVFSAVALLTLAAPALAWNGSSRGSVQWLTPDASASATVELVVTHEPNGRTRVVGTIPLPGELGDGVISIRIEAALLNAGRTSLPDPAVNLRYTEYFNNGDLAFSANTVREGTLRLDAYNGGLDLAFVATLFDANGTAWRQLSYTGAPLTPIDPDDLIDDTPPTRDGNGFVAAVLAPNNGCGSGYDDDEDYYTDRRDRTRDPEDDDDSDDWQWDNTATGSTSSTGGGCDADDTDDYSDDSSGGCDGDDLDSDTSSSSGSGCDSSSSDASSGCDGGEAASGCDCGGDALASSNGRRKRAWIARAVSWLPYFAVFGLIRVMRRRRSPAERIAEGEAPTPAESTAEDDSMA